MKTSVSLSVFSAPTGMPALFSGGSEKNIARIKELGYDGVDLFVKDHRAGETLDTIALLNKYHLKIGVIMPAALAGQGLFLGSPDSTIREKAIRSISEIILLASESEAMVSVGLVRGSKGQNESLAEFETRFQDSCDKMLKVSGPAGVDLLIEPINRYEINTINSVQEGIDFLQRTGLPMSLMIDFFHMNIEEVDIEKMLILSLPYVKHIHFVDSNRLAPSMGHLDMVRYYRLLEKMGYPGYLCLEVLPGSNDSDYCAVCGAAFFDRMKESK